MLVPFCLLVRKKFLRQNRELAKANNMRAMRIRQIENEYACMLSENLGLRTRIYQLEKELEDNDARRVADHAMAIKMKIESQLTEWCTLLSGLGEEPPIKRHSPRIERSSATRPRRSSLGAGRTSPSQRRLREVARDVEHLGHIAEDHVPETKRMSMKYAFAQVRKYRPTLTTCSPDQILALRSEADSTNSPELGPPPTSHFIDEEAGNIDPPNPASPLFEEASPGRDAPAVCLPLVLRTDTQSQLATMSEKTLQRMKDRDAMSRAEEPKPNKTTTATTTLHKATPSQPIKTGLKRKYGREDGTNRQAQRGSDENQRPRTFAEKASIRERADGKTLKEMANIRKETREKPEAVTIPRRPLSAKSTNDDVASPRKKNSKRPVTDDVACTKVQLNKPHEASGQRIEKVLSVKMDPIAPQDSASATTRTVSGSDLGIALHEAALLSPNTPERLSNGRESRGDTPPPAHITSDGETSRPSRRNRPAVSYVEPNLRDKMRRPSKQLFDAVAGEGKYARRMSQCEPKTAERPEVKREPGSEYAPAKQPASQRDDPKPEPDSIPQSPLLERKGGASSELSSSFVTERRRRRSSVAPKSVNLNRSEPQHTEKPQDGTSDSGVADSGDLDVYDFTDSSPALDSEEGTGGKRPTSDRSSRTRRSTAAAVESDPKVAPKERSSSRRRSMMV